MLKSSRIRVFSHCDCCFMRSPVAIASDETSEHTSEGRKSTHVWLNLNKTLPHLWKSLPESLQVDFHQQQCLFYQEDDSHNTSLLLSKLFLLSWLLTKRELGQKTTPKVCKIKSPLVVLGINWELKAEASTSESCQSHFYFITRQNIWSLYNDVSKKNQTFRDKVSTSRWKQILKWKVI